MENQTDVITESSPVLERLRWSFNTLSVLIGMVRGCFLGVVGRMKSMSPSDFRMVRSLLMTASLMMLRRLQMVFCRSRAEAKRSPGQIR
jgi:hypothetical protein